MPAADRPLQLDGLSNVLLYGREEPLPEKVRLRAGPLSLLFEEGDLRSIRLWGREVLRRIYVAVRDRNWGTVPAVLSDLRVEDGGESFSVSYRSTNRQREIDFVWEAAIRGDAQGTIVFTMEGEARSTFLRSRIGFCVLHPLRECAGQPCTVEKTDGSLVQGSFPLHISAAQPFRDLRAITHPAAPGFQAEVRFTGEVFEMEDHRNWTDASFKTYGTPLDLPYPVEVKEGTRVSQSVTLTLKGTAKAPAPAPAPRAGEPTFSLRGSPVLRFPRLGLSLPGHGRPSSARERARLKALNLSHLRVDLRLGHPGWPAVLAAAAEEARALETRLEAALFLSSAARDELRELRGLLDSLKPPVGRWLVFQEAEKATPRDSIREARRALAGPDRAEFGGGTDAYFAELNRADLPLDHLDLVSYSLNPQVHAFDNDSLVETLEGQAATVESARRLAKGLPVAVGPITLKPRFNPDATGPSPESGPGELPRAVDPRQMSLFGAAWTLGSMKSLLLAGASSLTYYETTGWLGAMETGAGSPLPGLFRSRPGSVFPLYHVFAEVGEMREAELIPGASSESQAVEGLALRKGKRIRLLLANLTPEPRRIKVTGAGELARIRHLDETSAAEAMSSPEEHRARSEPLPRSAGPDFHLDLLPYAVACLDGP